MARPSIDPLEQYRAAFAEQRLLYVRCNACDTAQLPLAAICRACGSGNLRMCESAGLGEIYSFTIVHRAPVSQFRDRVPYVLALLRLDEKFDLMVNILGTAESLAIGRRAQIVFSSEQPDAVLIGESR